MEVRKGMHPSFLNVIKQKERIKDKLSGIKNKIGVYSAKGGVGKTTVAINVAYALNRMGFRVGLLDADIDCPNVTLFLGIEDKIDISGFPLKPVEKDGIKIASTAMIVDDEKKPIIWRGPMVAKMLGDFFENTDWGELDYLVIDLPPGTSDAPLSIMQLLDMKGFILVTTPHRISAINSRRSGLMIRRFGVHILGIVENMSVGPSVSNETENLARDLGVEILGRVERSGIFSSMGDLGGVPVVENEPAYEVFKGMLQRLL